MKDRAQPSLCRPERQAPGGLGWAEGGGDGRVWGDRSSFNDDNNDDNDDGDDDSNNNKND